MADPHVKIQIESEGTTKDGKLTPSAGASIEVLLADSAKSRLAIDYTDPDVLRLSLSGDVTLRAGKTGTVDVSGSVDRSLLDGATTVRGKVTWEIPKSISVQVTTDLGKDEKKVGTRINFNF
ncbi:MAG: hypothetical protein U0167_13825 [bacterium]